MQRFASLFRISCCAALLALAAAQDAKDIPKIAGESLAGRRVVLPDATTGKITVLVIGFSKASKAPTSAWARKIIADFGSRSGFELYQLAVLQDVPRFIRGFVISGIKSGVPKTQHDHFLLVVEGEAELKKLVSYKEPDDAYMVVLDRGGKSVRQRHGEFSDASYSQLRQEIESLLSNQK